MIDKKILRNPKSYTADQGLTQTTQSSPVRVEEVDSSWMKATTIEGSKRGSIIGAEKYQKFVPYQAKYESTKTSNWGIAKQTDKQHPWLEYTESTWEDAIRFPPSFKGDYDIEGWYSNKINTTKELYQWKTDIFGNQYGLYKDFTDASMYEKKYIFGDFWINTINNVSILASIALSGIYNNYRALNETIYNQLTSNQIKDIDVFYDTLMIVTSSWITLDKILFDYDTNTITSIADASHTINLSAEKFADTWFFEDNKIVIFCSLLLNDGIPIPNIYELNLEKNSFVKRFPLANSDMTDLTNLSAFDIITIDNPLFTYNIDTKTYNIAFYMAIEDQSRDTLVLINIRNQTSLFELESVTTIIPTTI